MIGFVAALANEALTGASLWQQLYFAPYAYFSAYFLVAVAAQLNKAFGRPQQGTHTALPFGQQIFLSVSDIISGATDPQVHRYLYAR